MKSHSVLLKCAISLIALTPAFAGTVLYSNNSNPNVESGYGIGSLNYITDTFTLSAASTITEVDFVSWGEGNLYTPNLQLSFFISSTAFGQDYGSVSVTTSFLACSTCAGHDWHAVTGLDISLEAGS